MWQPGGGEGDRWSGYMETKTIPSKSREYSHDRLQSRNLPCIPKTEQGAPHRVQAWCKREKEVVVDGRGALVQHGATQNAWLSTRNWNNICKSNAFPSLHTGGNVARAGQGGVKDWWGSSGGLHIGALVQGREVVNTSLTGWNPTHVTTKNDAKAVGAKEFWGLLRAFGSPKLEFWSPGSYCLFYS